MSQIIKSYSKTKDGLVVELTTGNKYLYPEATNAHYESFEKANSKGSYFNKVIRKLDSVKLN